MSSKVVAPFCFPINNKWEFFLLYILASTYGCQDSLFWPYWCLFVVFICTFLMTCDVEYLSICLFVFCMSYLMSSLFKYFPYFYLDCLLFYYWVFKSLCLFWVTVRHQIRHFQILSPSLWLISSLPSHCLLQ